MASDRVPQHKKRLANDAKETREAHKKQVPGNAAESEDKSSQKQNASSSAGNQERGS